MSQEWYLLTTPHSLIDGFESDAFSEFAEDAMSEVLSSDVAYTVTIHNADLSLIKETRCIIEGNTQDTKLNAMKRRIMLPIGDCKAGQYVKYKNRYWLIVGLVDDNGIYSKAVMVLCNYLLTWRNDDGDVIQRWVNASSASQYNNGETGMKFYFVRSDQLMILTPDDRESIMLRSGQRFIIDRRCEFYEENISNTDTVSIGHELITYEITRLDNVVFDYQDSGHSEFMAYQCEQRPKDGYYKIGNKGYWLCEPLYNETSKTITNTTSGLTCKIEYDSNIVYDGLEGTVFTAKFYDELGEIDSSATPQWSIPSLLTDRLDIEYSGNSITITSNDDALVNKSFELSLGAYGYPSTSITVTIKAFM